MIDWYAATESAYRGIDIDPTITYDLSVKQWDVIHALELINQHSALEDVDGRYCIHTIDELEPTFENEWDYEYPNDFGE